MPPARDPPSLKCRNFRAHQTLPAIKGRWTGRAVCGSGTKEACALLGSNWSSGEIFWLLSRKKRKLLGPSGYRGTDFPLGAITTLASPTIAIRSQLGLPAAVVIQGNGMKDRMGERAGMPPQLSDGCAASAAIAP